MARRNFFTGLDVGSASIRAVVLEKGLEIIAAAETASDGVRKGAVALPEITARNIQKLSNDIKKNFGVEIDHAMVSLNEPRITSYISKGTVSVSRADGEVTREDVSRAIEASEAALPRLGNREIVHTFPLFYTVDGDSRLREAVGLNGMKLEVETLFVASFSAHLKNLIKAVEGAGLTVDDVLAAPYAASFQALTKKQKEVGSLLLDIGAQTSALAVFEEGSLISIDIIPVGSGHITYDIGLGFQIDIASAERVKRHLGIFLEQGKKEIRLADFPKNFEETFSQKKLEEIVEARLGDIFELVGKHLKKIDRAELLPGGVVLSGGGARLFDIQRNVREALRLPVEIAQGVPGLAGKKELVAGPEWMTAVGLARYAYEQHVPEGRIGSLFSSSFSRRLSRIFKSFIP